MGRAGARCPVCVCGRAHAHTARAPYVCTPVCAVAGLVQPARGGSAVAGTPPRDARVRELGYSKLMRTPTKRLNTERTRPPASVTPQSGSMCGRRARRWVTRHTTHTRARTVAASFTHDTNTRASTLRYSESVRPCMQRVPPTRDPLPDADDGPTPPPSALHRRWRDRANRVDADHDVALWLAVERAHFCVLEEVAR